MDPLKGKVAFVRKSAWVVESSRGMEVTEEPKAIPHSKRGTLLFKEDQEKAFHRDGAVWQNDLLGANE